MATIKQPTIIFCFSSLAVTQWKEQITKWTTVEPNKVCRFSSQHEGGGQNGQEGSETKFLTAV